MYSESLAKADFNRFILDNDHPCIMAKSVFNRKNYQLQLYEKLGSKKSAKEILEDIDNYLKNYDFSSNGFFSFIAVFQDNCNLSELEFENLLWQQLQLIHNYDDLKWDKNVSSNPKDEAFSFSIKGKAFYIVGMHPNSSRNSRKSSRPTLVFNLHYQFEKLREKGNYSRVKNTIRKRDLKKNGSINPMVEDFGKRSEAPQYSGRRVNKSWACPFKNIKTN